MRRPAIVIVTFKRQGLLAGLLESILGLTVAPWRVVVVDNENSPETARIVGEFSGRARALWGDTTDDLDAEGGADARGEAVMIGVAVGALALGAAYGLSGVSLAPVDLVADHSEAVLYALMFFVGISVGGSRGLLGKLRQYHVRVLIIPAGIVAGSVLGGLVCAPLAGMSLPTGAAVASGLGWYSLAGVMMTDIAGAQVGSITFLANLLRELVSFFSIPWIAKHLNYPTCIAPAGATSEDTTLPMLIRCTNGETVVLSVLNGVICSALVPVLIEAFHQFM